MEDGESQRDSVAQPRVASGTLGQANPEVTTLKRLHHPVPPLVERSDASPLLRLKNDLNQAPEVVRPTRTPGLMDAIPSGLSSSATTGPRPVRCPADVFDEGVEHDKRGRVCSPTLALVVDDTDAVYPIRIDPTFSDANWISLYPSLPGANDPVNAAVVDAAGNLSTSVAGLQWLGVWLPIALPNGTGAVGARWAPECVAVFRPFLFFLVLVRWRYRAATCMRAATSRRRAGCRPQITSGAFAQCRELVNV